MLRALYFTLSAMVLFAGAAQAQIADQIRRELGERLDGVELAAACENPPLQRERIKLDRLSFRAPEGNRHSLVGEGCFGRNQSGRLELVTQSTRDRELPLDEEWAHIEKGSVTWEGQSFSTIMTDFNLYEMGYIRVSLARRGENGELYQLTDWRNIRSPLNLRTGLLDDDGDGRASIASGGDDCDDNDPGRFPGNEEVADAYGVDEDCDPATLGNADLDGDGFIDDQVCNGAVCGDDCNDRDPAVNPHQIDILNGRDDNCDGDFDEDQTLDEVRRLLGL